MPKMIYADLSRCICCKACEVACEREHNGSPRIFVTLVDDLFATPVSCRQCEQSLCAAVCPTQALAADMEGIVRFDPLKCTGCTLCMFACPFGVIEFNHITNLVAKCDLCSDRASGGTSPACVGTCPTDALIYGEYDVFAQRIRQRNAKKLLQAIMVPNG
jgi:formate dehydrogenase iron-sulfur subunit